jgi:prolipoprotein diacylglyceryltransferase
LIASIPSPEQAVWFIGPFPVRAYSMFILVGIIVAVWITQRRLNATPARRNHPLPTLEERKPSFRVAVRSGAHRADL